MIGYQPVLTQTRKPALDPPIPLVTKISHRFTRMDLKKHIGFFVRLEVHEFSATSLRELVIQPSR